MGEVLITHADGDRREIGYVNSFERYDAQISADPDLRANDYALSLSSSDWSADPILIGHYLYAAGTEWGGPVEYIVHDTKRATVEVGGATWRGMLLRSVVEPPEGMTHKVIKNEKPHDAIADLIGDRYAGLFVVQSTVDDTLLSGQYRYVVLLTAISKLLASEGMTLRIAYDPIIKRVVLTVVKISDYTDRIDLSQDYGVDLRAEQGRVDDYNHVIALGGGEMLERTVLHLYRDAAGNITHERPDPFVERAIVYDYSNVESDEDLLEGAERLMAEHTPTDKITLDIGQIDLTLELGDRVSGRDRLTGLTTTASVVEKILTIDANGVSIETRVE